MNDNNPLIRFIDEQMVDSIKGLKEAAIENQKNISKVQQTCAEAIIRLAELMKQTHTEQIDLPKSALNIKKIQ